MIPIKTGKILDNCETLLQGTGAMNREKTAFFEDRIRRNGSLENWKLSKRVNVNGNETPIVSGKLETVDEIND